MKLVLEKDADLNSKANYGWTLLSLAAGKELETVANLLLEKNANVGSKDNFDWTLRLWAEGPGPYVTSP